MSFQNTMLSPLPTPRSPRFTHVLRPLCCSVFKIARLSTESGCLLINCTVNIITREYRGCKSPLSCRITLGHKYLFCVDANVFMHSARSRTCTMPVIFACAVLYFPPRQFSLAATWMHKRVSTRMSCKNLCMHCFTRY